MMPIMSKGVREGRSDREATSSLQSSNSVVLLWYVPTGTDGGLRWAADS